MDISANSSITSECLLVDYYSTVSLYINSVFFVLRVILLLPLSIFVLYLGHQQWQQQRSFTTTSHSDVFTCHVAAMELIWVLGYFWYIYGTYTNHVVTLKVGLFISLITFNGEIFFHVLTCVERYLAVVHPITYLGLRNTRGVRVRNISIGCVWLLSFGLSVVMVVCTLNNNITILICLLIVCILFITFCSLSVLSVLIRPRPGQGSGEKERVDQSKQRAFCTITAITCVVWMWFFGLLVSTALTKSSLLENPINCVMMAIVIWFSLPSSLVLPLLYLHRAGKLSCYLNNNE